MGERLSYSEGDQQVFDALVEKIAGEALAVVQNGTLRTGYITNDGLSTNNIDLGRLMQEVNRRLGQLIESYQAQEIARKRKEKPKKKVTLYSYRVYVEDTQWGMTPAARSRNSWSPTFIPSFSKIEG